MAPKRRFRPLPTRLASWGRGGSGRAPGSDLTVVPGGGGGAPTPSLYWNSTEPGTTSANSDVLFADDFSRGSWYLTNYDDAGGYVASNGGWGGTIYAGSVAGPTYITPVGACSADAAIYSSYAADGGAQSGTGGSNMADHNFTVDVGEFYIRQYVKFSSGYQFGAMKFMTLNLRSGGGIHFGDFHFNIGAGSASANGNLQFQPIGTSPEGNTGLNFTCVGNLHWYCIEFHCKQGSGDYTSDGILECWADDCGTDGLSGPAFPTLRYSTSTYRWPRANGADLFGNTWFENWANPGSTGTLWRKNVLCRKTGPIGYRTS
jgi:hypothetical protein